MSVIAGPPPRSTGPRGAGVERRIRRMRGEGGTRWLSRSLAASPRIRARPPLRSLLPRPPEPLRPFGRRLRVPPREVLSLKSVAHSHVSLLDHEPRAGLVIRVDRATAVV